MIFVFWSYIKVIYLSSFLQNKCKQYAWKHFSERKSEMNFCFEIIRVGTSNCNLFRLKSQTRTQMGKSLEHRVKISEFHAPQFYVKSVLMKLELSQVLFCQYQRLWIIIFGELQPKIFGQKSQNWKSNRQNGNFSDLNAPKLISRKFVFAQCGNSRNRLQIRFLREINFADNLMPFWQSKLLAKGKFLAYRNFKLPKFLGCRDPR